VTAAKTVKADRLEAAVARRLREAREAHGVKQVELANRAGVDAPAYSKFESGKRGLESARLLHVLVAAAEFGLDVQNYILRGIGAPGDQGRPVMVAATPELARKLLDLIPHVPKTASDEGPRPRRKK
jgi:transcriptional regulator with XRE-family HTH domain